MHRAVIPIHLVHGGCSESENGFEVKTIEDSKTIQLQIGRNGYAEVTGESREENQRPPSVVNATVQTDLPEQQHTVGHFQIWSTLI